MLRGSIGIVVGCAEAIVLRRAAQRSPVVYLSGGIGTLTADDSRWVPSEQRASYALPAPSRPPPPAA